MCSSEVQEATNAAAEGAPALENAVTQVGNGVASSAQQTLNKVDQVANDLEEWLGDDLVGGRNEAGDFWIRNTENTHKFRLDFFKTFPHENPHMHIQWLDEFGDWVGKRIFPNDVPPN